MPCRRIIRSNGDIGGYSLSVDFKRKLLKLEGAKFSNGRYVGNTLQRASRILLASRVVSNPMYIQMYTSFTSV